MGEPPFPPPDARLTRAPAPAPPAWFDIRADIAARVLSGSGVEIGGLHYPLVVPPGVEIRYVDRMSVPELRQHYPELDNLELVEVDIVDDGERLHTIEEGSLDFIVANHFLEHCHDPISTIGNHLRKLAPGGALYYAVPDKRFTFDVDRDVTPLKHIVRDHEDGSDWSRKQHFEEWARYVYEDPDEPIRSEDEVKRLARELDQQDYSIHTHVYTQAETLQLILHCRERFAHAFDIEVAWRRSLELIVVLRKVGPVAPPAAWIAVDHAGSKPDHRPAASLDTVAPPLKAARGIDERVRSVWLALRARADRSLASRRVVGRRGTAAARVSVPLSVLRPELDAGWPREARWDPAAEVGGLALPALELAAGARASFRVRLPAGASLTAKLAPSPAAGVDLGAARFTVSLGCPGRGELRSWSRVVERRSGWSDFHVGLGGPAERDVDLALEVTPVQDAGDGGLVHGLWAGIALELRRDTVPTLPTAPPSAGRPARDSARPVATRARASPLISVLMPVHDPDPAFLHEAIASVRRQTFGDWQLCLADDGSTDERVHAILDRHSAAEPRISLTRHAPARGIAAASNAALELASGEYIALVDHDDLIVHDALAAYAQLLAERPELDMAYSDEDRVSADGVEHSHTFLKPDWSPDFFRTAMYTCHLGVYRRELAIELGGFRSEFDGSQDYDFVLRLMEHSDRIGHIPRVLYGWRIHPRSAASGSEAKPAAAEVARQAIEAHLARTGVDGTVELGPIPYWYRVRHRVDPSIRVTLVIALGSAPASLAEEQALADCARSWSIGARDRVEVILAGTPATVAAHARLLSGPELDAEQFRFCSVDSASAPATLLNAAVRETTTELVVLCQELLEILSDDWFEQLAGIALQPGVGAAGGVVRTPDGRVDRGAFVFGHGWPLEARYGHSGQAFPALVANFRALSGPIMLRRATFTALGGLEDQLGQLALLDLCLRAGQRGMRAALCSEVAFARSALAVPASNDPALLAAVRERWRALGEDGYYNPGFWHGSGDFLTVSGSPA